MNGEGTNFRFDNKLGISMCTQLLSHELQPNERAFVASIMSQIARHPRKFELSAAQSRWFRSIWSRYKAYWELEEAH
jgi:hypothetical protein